jgi:hypothetical protein
MRSWEGAMRRLRPILGVLPVVGALFACAREPQTPKGGDPPMSITLKSEAFAAGGAIPTRHTGDGEDVSPALSWSGLPDGTRHLALVCDDPDAPSAKPWVHWVIYQIPADVTGLDEGVRTSERLESPAGAAQGANSWGTIGYRGPAPPRGHGTHHYNFTLYALDSALSLKPRLDKDELLSAIDAHVLAKGELVGTYSR